MREATAVTAVLLVALVGASTMVLGPATGALAADGEPIGSDDALAGPSQSGTNATTLSDYAGGDDIVQAGEIVEAITDYNTDTPPNPPVQTIVDLIVRYNTNQTGSGGSSAPTYSATVTSVVDGDTIEIRYQNGTTDTVRLLGIDTPETYGSVNPDEFEGIPDTQAGRDCLDAAADNASSFTTSRLDGRAVRLELDPAADSRGSFGRLLAYVHVDGENVNYRLVADGHARVYDSTFSQSDRFYDAESSAQSAEIGVWSCRTAGGGTTTSTPGGGTPTPTPTPDGASGQLVVSQIHEDAAGNDNENLNDEYVTFRNDGQDSLSIGGWTITDAAGHTYTVPSGVTLQAGASVTLYTGSGTDSSTALYWGSGSAIWNNAGDTITVEDESGAVALTREYS